MSDDQIIDSLMELLKDGDVQVGLPNTAEEIVRAETTLGRKLPPILRTFYKRYGYLIYDRKGHNSGNYICPLNDPIPQMNETLVSSTLFVHAQHADAHVSAYVFFGGATRPLFFGMSWEKPYQFVNFFGYMESPEVVLGDFIQLFREDITWHEECEEMFRVNRKLGNY